MCTSETTIGVGKKTVVADKPANLSSNDTTTTTTPWWLRGGMEVNLIGMAVNAAVPLFVLSKDVSQEFLYVFLFSLAAHMLFSLVVLQMRTTYCIALVPTCMTSLLFLATFASYKTALVIMLVSILLAMFKVGVCMSVCLHRYASHAAFRCNNAMRFAVMVLGCSANQGGPIWWASQHRCHHKHCDLPKDPHSAIQVGTEHAFSFFLTHTAVVEEFAPKHCDSAALRVLDLLAYLVVSLEFFVAYSVLGREGLFCAYTSAWICQTITLWFNVANHPRDIEGNCKASNVRATPEMYYPAFWFLEVLYPYFATIVGEGNHKHHHKHFALAKRGPYDLAYYMSIAPLQSMGLVWDVKGLEE